MAALHFHRRPVEFQLVDNEKQWVLTASTVMEEDTENASPLSLSFLIFTPFIDLGKYIGTSTNLDIIGIVIDKSAARKVNTQQGPATVQDVVLISQEKIPVILSLWNDFITTNGATAIASVGKFPILVVHASKASEVQLCPQKVLSHYFMNDPFLKPPLYANGNHLTNPT